MKAKFYLITSLSNECEVEIQKSVYCANDYAYLITDKSAPMSLTVKSAYESEKMMNQWIRKYDNLLGGLNYWKAKALSLEKFK